MTIFTVNNVDNYFKQDSNIDSFLKSLTQCYQNPDEIFQRVLSTNNIVFTSIDSDTHQIKGYLFYSDKENVEVTFENNLTKCIYNGYALVNELYRQSGTLHEILLYSTDYIKKSYENSYTTLLFYAVTSNPIALRSYYKIFKTVRPLQNGQLTEEDLMVAATLKSKLFINTKTNGHPFTFKTELPQRYVDSIRKTFVKSNLNEMNFLNSLSIDESSGDRFLFYWIV